MDFELVSLDTGNTIKTFDTIDETRTYLRDLIDNFQIVATDNRKTVAIWAAYDALNGGRIERDLNRKNEKDLPRNKLAPS